MSEKKGVNIYLSREYGPLTLQQQRAIEGTIDRARAKYGNDNRVSDSTVYVLAQAVKHLTAAALFGRLEEALRKCERPK